MNEPAVADLRDAFANAISHGDARAAASVYAGGARLLAPSAELIEGREAIEAFWRAGIDAGVAQVELRAIEVHAADQMAYEHGEYVLRLQFGADRPVVDQGRYVVVLEQGTDGLWRRALEMFNPERPSAAAAQPPMRVSDRHRRHPHAR
jgi:ketosteroid isomerase-like protein